MAVSRRELIKGGGRMLASAAVTGDRMWASPMNAPLGFQTFELLKHFEDNWAGTWKKMANFGYKIADLVHFGLLASKTPKEILQSLNGVGLVATNGHFSFGGWMDHYDDTVEIAHQLGLKSVVCALGPRRKTADDYKWTGEQLNLLGERLKKDGLALWYHNHEIEFVKVEGQVPWDILMANTDPKLVSYQIDVGNLTIGGGDAVYYLNKYLPRYSSLHCKDYVKGQASVPVGQGDLDWTKILAIAKRGGIMSYVTEVGAYGVSSLDGAPLEPSRLDVLESFRESFEFLNKVKNA